MPVSVSGVTTAPSEMPTITKHGRASRSGTFIGRPASAATATASIEPETRPAGKADQTKRDAADRRDQQRFGNLEDVA